MGPKMLQPAGRLLLELEFQLRSDELLGPTGADDQLDSTLGLGCWQAKLDTTKISAQL